MLTAGLLALGALGACKSEGSVAPPANGEAIANPRGLLNIGDVISLNVNGDSACTRAVLHPVRVVAIGAHSVILSDTLNPKGGFTTADFQRYAARFDTLVYPLDVENFGEPTDIDKNGRIAILFTRAVNELTAPRAASYVGGFAFSRDLFPTVGTTRAQACAGSNQGEMFYLLAPDPFGTINSNVRSVGFVDSVTTSVLAHEFQHLINASRRLYVNNTPAFEEKWLDEALAHSAEELLFYREAGLGSRLNLDITAIRASQKIRAAFNIEMSGNASRYKTYLASPATSSPYSANDSLTTRGASWSFLRYAIDRVNATDGFAAGSGQTLTSAGTATLSPGTTGGEYSITVVNTLVQGFGSATYSLAAIPAPGTPAMVVGPVPAASRAVVAEPREPALQPDRAFEARLRSRERLELTPRILAARQWYASQSAPAPAMLRSRMSRSTSALADADAALFFKLVNNATVGATNLQSVVGDLPGLVRDWSVSHAIDDVAAPATQYQQRSWNWHSLYPAIGTFTSPYPLAVQPLSITSTISNATVVSGGAAFYSLAVGAGASVTLTFSNSSSTANPSLQLIIVRTK